MSIAQPVLVTGGTGFIGRRLIDRLLESNTDVASFALPDEPVPDHWGGRVNVLRGDIRKPDDVNAAMSGINTVFHLAAVVGVGAYDVHWAVTVEGSRNLYDAAVANGTKVVLTSSIVVYGDQIQTQPCHDELDHGKHQGAYSRAKMAQEKPGQTLDATGETFSGGMLGREHPGEAVLRERLDLAVASLNPDLPGEALADAVTQLTRLRPKGADVRNNRDVWSLLRDGAKVEVRS